MDLVKALNKATICPLTTVQVMNYVFLDLLTNSGFVPETMVKPGDVARPKPTVDNYKWRDENEFALRYPPYNVSFHLKITEISGVYRIMLFYTVYDEDLISDFGHKIIHLKSSDCVDLPEVMSDPDPLFTFILHLFAKFQNIFVKDVVLRLRNNQPIYSPESEQGRIHIADYEPDVLG